MEEKQPTYELIGKGDKKSVAILYERYGKRLYGYALSSWKLNEDDAWDTVYKTLYKVVESSKSYSFESEEKFASFIFKVFINYLRTLYRDKKAKPDLLEFNDAGTYVTETVEETDSEQMVLLKEELDKLEDWERILLLMRSQDMPYSEIAKYVNKPAEQLKVYYQRLKAALLKRLQEKLAHSTTMKKEPDEKA
jgi:RNA polymerase sigma factor (sigma-70 family)